MEVSLVITPKRSGALDGLNETVAAELPDDIRVVETTTRMFAFSPPELRVVVDVEDGEDWSIEEPLAALDEVEAVERTL